MANEIINPPSLPTAIQGDGRVLLSLLNRYLNDVADTINGINAEIANTEEVPSNNVIATPQQFIMVSDRIGSVLRWNKVIDDNLDHYEIRTSDELNLWSNILFVTSEIKATVVPTSRSGRLYLYAVTKDYGYSNPNILDYLKAVPSPPQNVAISKNKDGSLIYYDPVPDDCIGANIYVNGVRYTTQDNLFLVKDIDNIMTFSICYYDSFGEGVHTTSYLKPETITNFVATRNGDYVDFSWDGIQLYNVEYEIRKGNSWDNGERIYKNSPNKYKFYFPNSGQHTFWIKSVDEYGNYCEEATFFILYHDTILNHNVILQVDQKEDGWPGTEINMVFDPYSEGLELEPGMLRGEHLVEIELPKKYLARNWIDYAFTGVGEYDATWDDAEFEWDSLEADTTWIGNLNSEGIRIAHRISRFLELPADVIESYSLNTTTTGINGTLANEAVNIAYADGRFRQGANILDSSKVSWSMSPSETFNISFCIRTATMPTSGVIYATIAMTNGNYAYIGYNDKTKSMCVGDNRGNYQEVPLDFRAFDYVTMCMIQTATQRKLYAMSFVTKDVKSSIETQAPIGTANGLFLYPKFI